MEFRHAPKTPGIYLITNTVNGHRYVGQAKNVRSRWYTHRWQMRHDRSCNKYLKNAWKHYGEAVFEFSALEDIKDGPDLDARLNARETFWINALGPEYNIAREGGTRRGVPQPPEAVAVTASKIRGRAKPNEWKEEMRQRRTGMKFPEEWAANIRASKQNVSAETRAKQSVSARRRGAPLAATTAAAEVNRGKKRPPHVIAAIRLGQQRRWERIRAAQSASA